MFSAFTFGLVVFTFVYWVDGIARLGRMGGTIDKVEMATHTALKRRRLAPPSKQPRKEARIVVFAAAVGYVQHIKIPTLQDWAERHDI